MKNNKGDMRLQFEENKFFRQVAPASIKQLKKISNSWEGGSMYKSRIKFLQNYFHLIVGELGRGKYKYSKINRFFTLMRKLSTTASKVYIFERLRTVHIVSESRD